MKKILIVDDQQGVRALLKVALSSYELKEATNGRQALDIVQQWQPDLLIIDMKMPVLDGLETLTALKKTNLPFYPKILMMTAYTNGEIQEKLQKIKLSGVVTKPFDLEELVAKVDRVLFEKPGD